MKTRTDSLLALAVLLLVSAMFQPVYAQENGKAALSSSLAERAFQYFEKTVKGELGDYLKSIRPPGISPEQRARQDDSTRRRCFTLGAEAGQTGCGAFGPGIP